jgi:hypothetical protein
MYIYTNTLLKRAILLSRSKLFLTHSFVCFNLIFAPAQIVNIFLRGFPRILHRYSTLIINTNQYQVQ